MRKLFIYKVIVIAILLTSTLEVSAKLFYIAPSPLGNDLTGNGSASSPWQTLSKACSQVNTPGDTIFVKAGIYNETIKSNLAIGVSLIGEGNNSIITSTSITAEWTTIINMASLSMLNGNQSISYLKFDGASLSSAMAMDIRRRNGVEIHNCTFVDFHYCAVNWVGDGGNETTAPTNYVTGSKFYNNIVTNCAAYTSFAYGALYIGGQEGMLIYDNNISQTGRPAGTNGWPIKIWSNGGWVKGLKIYNNILYKDDLAKWPFCIEGLWHQGVEIFNNTITGAIDLNHSSKGKYDYGVYIHNNTLGPFTQSALRYEGIVLEFDNSDVIIKNNHFRNLYIGVLYTPRTGNKVTNQEISYNLFEGLCNSGWGIMVFTDLTYNIGTFNVYNNIFYSNPDNKALYGIGFSISGTGDEINLINNIFVNFSLYWGLFRFPNNLSVLNLKNNIFFSNANSNTPNFYGSIPQIYNNSGNIIDDPDFYSNINFHPKSDSPCIDAGVPITNLGINIFGLIIDMDGILIVDPPNIGCFETKAELVSPSYVSSVIEDCDPSLLIINYDMALIQIVPDKSYFEVKSNSQVVPITSIKIVDGKVHIILGSPISFGDKVTLLYLIPPDNALQSVTNINASEIPNLFVTNKVESRANGNSLSLTINIYPNPVSDVFTLSIEGDIPKTASIFRIYSLSGVIVFETPFNYSLLNNPINVNLKSGIYIASLLSDSSILCAAKLMVVK